MRTIQIRRLRLENFKCHHSLELCFDGRNATIYGDNATGKTSVYDAFTWLLFGKDSEGNTDRLAQVAPLDENGEVKDHLAVTAVEAVLTVDGTDMTLRRTRREVWATKRGGTETTFDGMTSEYYIDGVPVKCGAFQQKVDELLDEDTFRLLTCISHFAAGISWQERRNVLLRLTGLEDDSKIISSDERFAPLAVAMGLRTPADFKKLLQAQKKKHEGAASDIPARISEQSRGLDELEGLDFSAAKETLDRLYARKELLASELTTLTTEHSVEIERIRAGLNETRLQLAALDTENLLYRQRQSSAAPDHKAIQGEIAGLEIRLSTKTNLLDNARKRIAAWERKLEDSRATWVRENARSFEGDGICPNCGQVLPQERMEQAVAQFEAEKQERLEGIVLTANQCKEGLASEGAQGTALQEECQELEQRLSEMQTQLAGIQDTQITDMPDYEARRQSIVQSQSTMTARLAELQQEDNPRKRELQNQLREVETQIAEQLGILRKEDILAEKRQRLAQLREDATRAAGELEQIARMLFLLEEYSRYKARFLEDSVNGFFRLAQFRLFRQQANGGLEERCDVVYNGVTWTDLNQAARVNVGIDIIDTLSAAFGVCVPLFVDNAESVVKLAAANTQVIRLVVSAADKELRCEYEN